MKPQRIQPGDKVAISRTMVSGWILCPLPGHDNCGSVMCDTFRGRVRFACGHECQVIFTYQGQPVNSNEELQ